VSTEVEHIWSRVQAELAAAVGEPTYRIWLEPLRALELRDSRLLIEAPRQTRGWTAERFGRIIQACVAAALGPEVVIDMVAGEAPASGPRATGRCDNAASAAAGGRASPASPAPLGREPECHPKLTFDHFVIGDSNRLAHAASLTVAEMPAQAYNPLFLYGPPGLGKTHLLRSIAAFLADHGGGLAVRYTTGEAFTTEFLAALQAGSLDRFKARFRHVDVLLLDDVQFLERKTRTEEEFFHTFNALYDAGSQLVVSSDRLPRNMDALEQRLRERFEAGLVADIGPPDLATRLTILRKRVDHDGIRLADARALEVIAERVVLNVRALEGALIRVVAFASLTGRALTAELAAEVIDGLYPAERRAPRSIAEIQAAACEQFDVTAEELLSTTRIARVAWPRQVAMYLARELTGESLPAIGRGFGGRDHTTVLHAWRRTGQRISSDAAAHAAVAALVDRLGGPPPERRS
jgi:chromosomal replication initiator protein